MSHSPEVRRWWTWSWWNFSETLRPHLLDLLVGLDIFVFLRALLSLSSWGHHVCCEECGSNGDIWRWAHLDRPRHEGAPETNLRVEHGKRDKKTENLQNHQSIFTQIEKGRRTWKNISAIFLVIFCGIFFVLCVLRRSLGAVARAKRAWPWKPSTAEDVCAAGNCALQGQGSTWWDVFSVYCLYV